MAAVIKTDNGNVVIENNVIANIKKQGVAAEDIKTSSYVISPKYNYDNKTGSSTIAGYQVTSTLSVTVKNINSVGNIIDGAIANGANNSNGITFGISNYEKYYNIALTNAILNAKAKAQAIAGCIDVKLSIPSKITENSNGVPVVYPVFNNASAAKSISGGQDMTVETGSYTVKANVSMVYEY